MKRRRAPLAAPPRRRFISPPAQGAPVAHHDALLLTRNGSFYQFPHAPGSDDFTSPANKIGPRGPAERKVRFIARDPEGARMTLGTLPLHQEPGREYFSCYLTNEVGITPRSATPPNLTLISSTARIEFVADADGGYAQPPRRSQARPQNDGPAFAVQSDGYLLTTALLRYDNPWTVADWSQGPKGLKRKRPLLDFVVGQGGQILRVEVRRNTYGVSVEPADAVLGPVVQGQFDRGAVLGAVRVRGQRLPFVNLDAIAGSQPRLIVTGQEVTALCIELGPTASTAVEVDFKVNAHVWSLLRNGCIVGDATLRPFGTTPGPRYTVVNLASVQRGPVSPAAPRIAGTLDFKWTVGSALRVAVRLGDNTRIAGVVQTLTELARLWLADTSLRCSVFAWDEAAPYDMLVDADPLPRSLPNAADSDPREVTLPESALGRYARRRSWGAATTYVGYVEGLLDGGRPVEPAGYFDHPVFRHIALHELGHAFGLPHLHQCPKLNQEALFGRDPDVMAASISKWLGVQVDGRYLREEVLGKWPSDTAEYDQWPPLDEHMLQASYASSVMVGAPLRAILRDRGTHFTTLFPVEPSPIDRAWIRLLYPPA